MKSLLILRHAKSRQDVPGLADHDRPLNQRGQHDAPRMGRLLARERLVPEMIISSTATRACTTATRVAEACGHAGPLELTRRLYLSGPLEHLSVVSELGDDAASLMVVGHNPDLEELVHLLTGESTTLPTAALARIELPIDSWSELAPGVRGRLAGVWRPKELPDST
jgi:phosphohistidine phosphatase